MDSFDFWIHSVLLLAIQIWISNSNLRTELESMNEVFKSRLELDISLMCVHMQLLRFSYRKMEVERDLLLNTCHVTLTSQTTDFYQTNTHTHTQSHILPRRPKQARHELIFISLVKMLPYLPGTEQTHLQQIDCSRLWAYQERLDTLPGAQG